MAISPPSDIVLDVARAADPAALEAARARLMSIGGAKNAEAFSQVDLAAVKRNFPTLPYVQAKT